METKTIKSTKELLVEHFLKWQFESGETKTQAEFSIYIGEGQKYLSMVLNGRPASKRQIAQTDVELVHRRASPVENWRL